MRKPVKKCNPWLADLFFVLIAMVLILSTVAKEKEKGDTNFSKSETSSPTNGATPTTIEEATPSSIESFARRIVYISETGTELGSTTETHLFGESVELVAPEYEGYTTPLPITLIWGTDVSDFEFIYVVKGTANASFSGQIWDSPEASYVIDLEMGERTEDSIKVRVKFNLSMGPGWTVYGAKFVASVFIPGTPREKEASTDEVTILQFNEWKTMVNNTRNATAYSEWITVPLASESTEKVNMWIDMWWFNSNGTNMYNYDGTPGVEKLFENIPIPKY